MTTKRHTTLRKKLIFIGASIEDLRDFPADAKKEAGFQLGIVQRGLEPDDWKPMPDVGPGCKEIRIREESGAFRIIYVAKFAGAVYVLHCFPKKTQKIPKADMDIAATRYKDLVRNLNKP